MTSYAIVADEDPRLTANGRIALPITGAARTEEQAERMARENERVYALDAPFGVVHGLAMQNDDEEVAAP